MIAAWTHGAVLQLVCRTLEILTVMQNHMSIDHRCADVLVPKKLLNLAYIGATHQQMRRERMTQGMAGGMFVDTCSTKCFLEGPLHCPFVDMMPTDRTTPRVFRSLGGWKKLLPAPLL